ncbi:MAG: acetolactate decarboxylase [Peptococcaceae bacterium]|nr:acetolactate decarboxylase [Peptococcaceae bacterium]
MAKDKIYQVALLQSLTLGQYDGFIHVGELKKHGDTGIGTFDGMDGELIMLDGVVYQGLADGSIVEAVDDALVPFGDVTFFKKDFSANVAAGSLKEMHTNLSSIIARHGINAFYMVKLSGHFHTVQVRSEHPQQKPYPPLDVVMSEQAVFNLHDIQGTVIAFYCPSFMEGQNTVGWHSHFISEDKKSGGHILGLSADVLTAAFDKTLEYQVILPDDDHFHKLDLSADLSETIAKAEGTAQ